MNFYFQSGEFISSNEGVDWINIITTIFAALIGGLVAYLVARFQIKKDREHYLVQLKDQEVYESNKENSRLREKLLYFVWLLEEIHKTVLKQNEKQKNLAIKLKENALGAHLMSRNISYVFKRIFELNQEEIFQSFLKIAGLTDENRVFIRQVYSNIDFLDGANNELLKQFQGMHLEVHALKSEYRNYIEEIREDIAEIVDTIANELKSAKVTDPLWKFLNKVLIDYNLGMPKDGDVDWHHPNFLRPLQEKLVLEFINKPEIKSIVIKGRRASILVGRIEHTVIDMANTFIMYGEQIDIELAKLDSNTSNIKKLI